MTFAISRSTCDRLIQYYDETEHDPFPRTYGFAARPRRHEGAGCSAYGVSFLEVAGLMKPEWRDRWIRRVRVPLSLMPGFGAVAPLSVREVLNHADAKQWSVSEPHMELAAFDPDLMHAWLVKTSMSIRELHRIQAKPDASMSHLYPLMRAIAVDATTVPTPSEPLFEGPADLKEAQPGMFMRGQIDREPNGSFVLPP